jgi:hypothetical protein
MVPENPDDIDVEKWAEDNMYSVYENNLRNIPEIDLERDEDEHFLMKVSIDIPKDKDRQKELGKKVGKTIRKRNKN